MKNSADQPSGIALTGYSERGMLNSLLHEISYHKNGLRLLGVLLGQVRFPFRTPIPRVEPVSDAEVIIEQSLGDFGDSDCVILLRNGGRGRTIFVEAKVTTSQAPGRYFKRELDSFERDVGDTRKLSGDLFSQLYRKLVLTRELASRGLDKVKEKGIEVENGEKYRNGRVRRLGKNTVVLRAAEKIAAHLSDVLYVAILPLGRTDPRDTDGFAALVKKLLDESQSLGSKLGLDLWRDFLHDFGFLTWLQVEEFCADHQLNNTTAAFHHNARQISAHLMSNAAPRP